MSVPEARARRLVDLYREGRIEHPEPVDWGTIGARLGAQRGEELRLRHPNRRCMIDGGDPTGDRTVVSFQGPDGRYHVLPNVAVVGIGIGAHGELSGVPANAEPLAPPPSWLPRYRPR